MKKLFLFSVVCLFLSSCTQIKQHQMRKDADKFIETVINCGFFSMEYATIGGAFEQKYQGDDRIKFMNIVRSKVEKKREKGEDCGQFDLIFQK